MNAMLYLIRKEIKNTLLEMLRHPGRLVLYLVIFAFLIISVLSPKEAEQYMQYADFRILQGAYLAILLLIGLPVIFNGLKNGATFFKMSDVNFLFVSPISARQILAYGLVKQIGTSFLMMFFLLFYSATLSQLFGIVTWQMVVLVFGAALLLFTAQLVTLLIYGFSNGSPGRIRLAKICIYGLLGAAAGYVLIRFFAGGSGVEALLAAVSSPVLDFVPVFGWIRGLVFGIIQGRAAETAAYAALNLITVGGGILLFLRSNPDYYEDVLQSTESAYEQRNAVKEGRSFQNRRMPERAIRVTDTGIGHGWGASVFFYKHLRQYRRRSRLPFVSVSTLVLTVGNVAFGSFLRQVSGEGLDRMPAGLIMAACLAVSSYILFFFNLQGDWSLELMKPYIYLVPEKPFSKLMWASLSTVLKPAVDGVVIFTVLGIFLHANPATAFLCMLLYASVSFLYVAVNVLSQRVLGQMANKGLFMLFYMFLLLLLFAPGAVVSGILYDSFGSLPGIVVGLPVAVWNTAVSLGIFAACRNLLSTVEYNL